MTNCSINSREAYEAALANIMQSRECTIKEARQIFEAANPGAAHQILSNNALLPVRVTPVNWSQSVLASLRPQGTVSEGSLFPDFSAIRSFFAKILNTVFSLFFRRPVENDRANASVDSASSKTPNDSRTQNKLAKWWGGKGRRESAVAVNAKAKCDRPEPKR